VNTYDVWMEGFRATGNESRASKVGQADGTSFEEACKTLLTDGHSMSNLYDPNRNTVWGCRLFRTEGEARASFG